MTLYTDPDKYRKQTGPNPELSHEEMLAAREAEAKAEHCEPEMVLPAGVTCSACVRFAWCENHFGCKPSSRHCDWNPHRFTARRSTGATP